MPRTPISSLRDVGRAANGKVADGDPIGGVYDPPERGRHVAMHEQADRRHDEQAQPRPMPASAAISQENFAMRLSSSTFSESCARCCISKSDSSARGQRGKVFGGVRVLPAAVDQLRDAIGRPP